MDAVGSALIAMKRAQLEARIQELKKLISQYNDKINYYNRQIRSADKTYESITNFKGSVQSSQDSFAGVSNVKSNALNQVNAVSTNNTVAKKYYAGMKRILSGTGAKITTKLYQFILGRIQSEQSSLRNKSNDASDKVNYYTRLLNNAKAEYNAKVQELQSL